MPKTNQPPEKIDLKDYQILETCVKEASHQTKKVLLKKQKKDLLKNLFKQL